MKKLFTTTFSIIFFLFICNCYAQKHYKFDKIVNATFSTKLFPNQKWTNLFNSEDASYYMRIYHRNDSLVSRITDNQHRKIHYFYVDKADSMKLKFLKTHNLKKVVKDYRFEFSQMKKKKDSKEILFKIFNNKNKRIANYKLKVKETDKNLFSIFKLSSLETLLFTKIIPSTNFLVLEAKGTNTNESYVKYKLDAINDINLKVNIPD